MVAKSPEAGSRRTCISTTDRRGRGAQYVHPHIGCARSLRLLDGPGRGSLTGTARTYPSASKSRCFECQSGSPTGTRIKSILGPTCLGAGRFEVLLSDR